MPRNLYGPDHEAFRSSVHEFVERTLKPRAEQMLEVKSVDRDIWKEAGKQGLFEFVAVGSFLFRRQRALGDDTRPTGYHEREPRVLRPLELFHLAESALLCERGKINKN